MFLEAYGGLLGYYYRPKYSALRFRGDYKPVFAAEDSLDGLSGLFCDSDSRREGLLFRGGEALGSEISPKTIKRSFQVATLPFHSRLRMRFSTILLLLTASAASTPVALGGPFAYMACQTGTSKLWAPGQHYI